MVTATWLTIKYYVPRTSSIEHRADNTARAARLGGSYLNVIFHYVVICQARYRPQPQCLRYRDRPFINKVFQTNQLVSLSLLLLPLPLLLFRTTVSIFTQISVHLLVIFFSHEII
jgi:hypothetical protein